MDFAFTSEQLDLRTEVIEFAQTQLAPNDPNKDKNSEFSLENWKKCGDFGLLGGSIPIELGGKGRDTLSQVIALEALGYAYRDFGFTLGVNALVWTILEPIMTFGTDEQKREFIPPLISGKWIASDCITEENAGSDAMAMQSTATKCEGGYVLNGEKCYIGFAPIADVLLVLAKTDPDAGSWGISAFLIKSDLDGIRLSENREKMGLRTLPMGNVTFENCFVPESARLGGEGIGLSMFNSSMEWERCFVLGSNVGAMEYRLEQCIEHARQRSQFGKRIGSFQSVSNRIADMKLRLETSKLLLYKCAWLKSTGQSAAMESALSKLHLSESILASSMEAIRINGAKGYLSEFEIERELRDSAGGVIYAGTSDIQRNLIARMLGI